MSKKLPVREMMWLPVKPVSQDKKNNLPLIILILGILFALAYCADNFTSLTQTAHAEAPQHEMTDKEKCQLIKDGEEVRGATQEEVTKFCAKYK